MPSLLGDHFDAVPDPRRDHGKRHALSDLFALTLCAVAGANDFVAVEAFGHARLDWLRRFVPLENGVPSHDTLARVFALLDRAHFEASFAAWAAEAFEKTAGRVVALDGKRLRRAHDAGEPMMMVVSAWATESGAALGQVATTDGEGEITAIPRLLALLDLTGCIVTTDAAGCQTDIAAQIVKGGGDYVLAVKGNQAGLHEACERWLFEATLAAEADAFETAERGHGREEVRRLGGRPPARSAPVPSGAARKVLWAGLRSVGMVESSRTVDGKTTTEQRYFASSLDVNAEALARAVRGHWGVENGLHWTLDVSFREDESRSRMDHAAANLSVVRRLAATLVKGEASGKGGVQTRRMRAAWDERYLAKVLRLE